MDNYFPDENLNSASNLLDNLGVGVIFCDLKENIKFANKSANLLFGSDDKNYLIGKNFIDFTDKATSNLIMSQTENRKKGEKSVYEINIRISKTESKTIHITALPYYDNDRKIIGVFGVFIDSTELNNYQKKYQDVLDIYQGLFDNVTEAIYIQDVDGKFLDVNIGAMKMYGYEREEFLGKSPKEISAEGKNDLEYVNKCVELAYNGEPQTFEFWGKRKNGKEFPKEVRLYPANYFGKKVVLALAIDISEKKLAEQSLTTITETLLSFGTIANENLNKLVELCGTLMKADIALYNKMEEGKLSVIASWRVPEELEEANKSYGYLCANIIKEDLNDIKVVNNLDINFTINNVNYVIKTYIGCPIKLEGKTIGTLCLLYKNYYTLTNFEKKNLSIIASAISVEEKRRLSELDLKISKQKLIETNAAKDKFFNIIAHDLKNPFHSILGLTDIMVDEYDAISDEKKKRFINNINSVAKDTYKLLENLLEWARSQTGRIEYNPLNFDFYNTLSEVCNLLHAQAFNKDVQILPAVPVNTIVFADPRMVQTILKNIINNAIKYSFPHSNVIITTENIDDYLLIAVIDKGVGMKPENLSKLFKIDEQFKSEGTANEKGTGIGLLICKELIAKNNGKIWATSEFGKGSIFYFTLPTMKVK